MELVRTRITEHKSHIKNKTSEAPLVLHFLEKGNNPDLRFMVLYKFASFI